MNYELFKIIHGMAGHNKLLDGFMIFCTNSAIYIFGIALLLMWIFGNEYYKKSAFYAGVTGLVALCINFLITLVYYEPRPFVTHHVHLLISHAADASFPSDHTTGAFAIAMLIWLRNRKIGGIMILFALLTGFSRIWVGHHYPFDVLGSVIVATVIAILIKKITKLVDPLANLIISIYYFLIRKKRTTNPSNFN
ncbi:undecaprenyl-diphosphatase [Priestia megaterium]|uniref:undecaprenyl-diphosphatase n=1 Tax=Priestia megaterium TaxID=1404 RepID=UPI001B3A2FF7|nr:undecaprenyl-diphosphatase [Priestia megaterium]MBQ4869400.1 undecaprenyl-diphosphatase [Priestia megaterium]